MNQTCADHRKAAWTEARAALGRDEFHRRVQPPGEAELLDPPAVRLRGDLRHEEPAGHPVPGFGEVCGGFGNFFGGLVLGCIKTKFCKKICG